jgi:hypothetical protein
MGERGAHREAGHVGEDPGLDGEDLVCGWGGRGIPWIADVLRDGQGCVGGLEL